MSLPEHVCVRARAHVCVCTYRTRANNFWPSRPRSVERFVMRTFRLYASSFSSRSIISPFQCSVTTKFNAPMCVRACVCVSRAPAYRPLRKRYAKSAYPDIRGTSPPPDVRAEFCRTRLLRSSSPCFGRIIRAYTRIRKYNIYKQTGRSSEF